MGVLQLPSSIYDDRSVNTGASDMDVAFCARERVCLSQEHLRYLVDGQVSITEPMIIAIGGLSGSGKSTLAQTISKLSIVAHISSDGVRGEINSDINSEFDQSYGSGIYTKEERSLVYEEMIRRAQLALKKNLPVIIEATFLDSVDRDAIERLAIAEGVPFLGLWCDAPQEELRARVLKRAKDPNSDSDAGIRVLSEQLTLVYLAGITWTKISSFSSAVDR